MKQMYHVPILKGLFKHLFIREFNLLKHMEDYVLALLTWVLKLNGNGTSCLHNPSQPKYRGLLQ